MIEFLLFFSLMFIALGPFIVWPSRYNVTMTTNFGFVFVAYFIPLILLDNYKNYHPAVYELYKEIHFFGVLGYAVGLIFGSFIPLIKTNFSFNVLDTNVFEERTIKLVNWFTLFSVFGMLISFAVMGFIPAFAADPFMAKFFKGQYRDPYMKIAVLYRLSYFLLNTLMPFLTVIWYVTRSRRHLVYLILVILLLAVTLSRGAAIGGLLLGLGLIFAKRGRRSAIIYSISVLLFYVLGSISYYLIGLLFDLDSYTAFYDASNVWQMIADGSPDINDQMTLLSSFLDSGSPYTMGKTFIGGLVPGNYEWNPSVWTLLITNSGTDLTEISSGGMRLTLPIWGYVSFGWAGVFFLPFFSGIITTYILKFIKRWMYNINSLIKAVVIISLMSSLGMQLMNFYLLSMYSVPVIITILIFSYRYRVK